MKGNETMKLTKLEEFVIANQEKDFRFLAASLNRPLKSIEQAYVRGYKKLGFAKLNEDVFNDDPHTRNYN
jgi:hypothetical protein